MPSLNKLLDPKAIDLKLILATLLTIILFVVQSQQFEPPTAIPATADKSVFSGERAFDILTKLIAEELPHPVGSKQNKIVRQRIIDHLSMLDIQVETQTTWACATKANVCAEVENVMGIIPGEQADSYIVLMAHYDSVPQAPGAGDDGAAVAAILESARILKAESNFKHSILLLFTDSEEVGLLGAEAFYQQHPLAKQVAAVLDFEGSGTSGISLLLRASDSNAQLIKTLNETSDSAIGFAFTNEIFKRMPNDTDFSVALRANLKGIDFAFAGERNHYHTPNDNLSNINIGTIQHHGENMLPLTRALANADLSDIGGHLIYGVHYGTWLQWLGESSIYLLMVGLFIFAIGLYRSDSSFTLLASHIGIQLLIIISSVITGLICFKFIDWLQGTTVNWPANSRYHMAALFSACFMGGIAPLLLLKSMLSKHLKSEYLFRAACLIWAILTIAITVKLPDASSLFIPALIFNAFILLLSESGIVRPHLRLLCLLPVVPVTIAMVPVLEGAQGYSLIAATMPFIALFLIHFVSLINHTSFKFITSVSSFFVVASLVAITATPMYSAFRPQHVNILFSQDLDKNEARLHLESNHPLPKNLFELAAFQHDPHTRLPLSGAVLDSWAAVEPVNFTEPEINTLSKQETEQHIVVDITIRSARAADRIALIFPQTSGLSSASIIEPSRGQVLNIALKLRGEDSATPRYELRFMGRYANAISLRLSFDKTKQQSETIEGYLADISTQLPVTLNEIFNQRPPLASPVHRGDQAVLFKKVSF